MKHSLQLRLSQHLTLTPQRQQSIRLLQLSTIELNQELERILQENPLLEREDGASETPPPPLADLSAGTRDQAPATQTSGAEDEPRDPENAELGALDDVPGAGYRDDSEEGDYPQLPADSPTLRAHLLAQLSLTNVSEPDAKLVALLVDSLDDAGYLTQGLDELLQMLPPELGTEAEDLQIALKHLQNLEPIGVGARNLSECLVLQLAALPPETPCRDEALETARHHLEVLAARDFAKLKKVLRCGDDVLRGVQKLITSLNPRPGRDYSSDETRYVVPDVIVKKIKGLWVASLNPDAMPRLRINRLYADILQRNRGAGSQQLATQLQEAKWLIKNVQQRFETILRVSQAIVDRQRNFFEHGEVAMRPLVLREIAEGLDLHESTVSRVTTQKFMHTARGIFELKYFFGSHVTTETGGAASSTAIRALIKEMIGSEKSGLPLSDAQLAQILGEQGIQVARRTVTKYRRQLQVPSVEVRRRALG